MLCFHSRSKNISETNTSSLMWFIDVVSIPEIPANIPEYVDKAYKWNKNIRIQSYSWDVTEACRCSPFMRCILYFCEKYCNMPNLSDWRISFTCIQYQHNGALYISTKLCKHRALIKQHQMREESIKVMFNQLSRRGEELDHFFFNI